MIVEDASRLARAVLVQELAIVLLKARDVRVLAANGDDLTETDDEMKNAMRQMAVVFAELEKKTGPNGRSSSHETDTPRPCAVLSMPKT